MMMRDSHFSPRYQLYVVEERQELQHQVALSGLFEDSATIGVWEGWYEKWSM